MSSARLTILLACAATVAAVIYCLLASGKGVRVYSVDRRLKICDAQYFSGTDFGYSYFAPDQKLKLQCIRFLRIIGLEKKPWARKATPSPTAALFHCHGPALFVCGEVQDGSSAQFELLADGG